MWKIDALIRACHSCPGCVQFRYSARYCAVPAYRIRLDELIRTSGGIVNRNFMLLGVSILAVAGAVYAQDPDAKPAPKKATGANAAAIRKTAADAQPNPANGARRKKRSETRPMTRIVTTAKP